MTKHKYAIMIAIIINISCSNKKETQEQIEAKKTLPSFAYKDQTIYVYPSDNSEHIIWGYATENINQAQDSVNGQSNTRAIVNYLGDNHGEQYAAKLCNDLVAYGFDDWYLPSQNELNLMYKNKNSIGGFSDKIYLSSTQVNFVDISGKSFFTGLTLTNLIPSVKNSCRCIRKDN